MLSSVEDDLHVGAEESEESGHSVGGNFSLISGVKVIPGLSEVLIEIVVSGLSLESHMGLEDLLRGHSSGDWVEVEITSWLFGFLISSLHSVLLDHGSHEEIVSNINTRELSWDNSLIRPVAIESTLRGEVVSSSLDFDGGNTNNKKGSNE